LRQNQLASLDEKGILTFWETSTLQVAARSRLDPAMVGTLALSHDGKKLASGNHKGQLAIWDLQRLQPVMQPIQIAGDRIDRLSFAPDDKTLAVVALGREVVLWDLAQQQRYPTSLQADPEYVRDAVFSKDGSRLLTTGDGGEIIQWDWRMGRRIGWSVKSGVGLDALALSPNGLLLAAGDYNSKVTLWHMTGGQRVGVPLVGHTNFVRTVAYSRDVQFLASGGDDGTVLLWDVNSYQVIAQFSHGATMFSGDGTARLPLGVNRVAFSPDGKLLAADGPENRIVLWDVDVSSWKQQACRIANRNLTEEEWKRYVSEQDTYSATYPGGLPRDDLQAGGKGARLIEGRVLTK